MTDRYQIYTSYDDYLYYCDSYESTIAHDIKLCAEVHFDSDIDVLIEDFIELFIHRNDIYTYKRLAYFYVIYEKLKAEPLFYD